MTHRWCGVKSLKARIALGFSSWESSLKMFFPFTKWHLGKFIKLCELQIVCEGIHFHCHVKLLQVRRVHEVCKVICPKVSWLHWISVTENDCEVMRTREKPKYSNLLVARAFQMAKSSALNQDPWSRLDQCPFADAYYYSNKIITLLHLPFVFAQKLFANGAHQRAELRLAVTCSHLQSPSYIANWQLQLKFL